MKNFLLLTILILSLKSNTIAQSVAANSQNKKQILSYYSSKDIVLMAGPVVEGNRIVLYLNGQDVIGFYGWASQGEEESYLVGEINGTIITAKKYSLFDSTSSPIKLTIISKAIITISPIGKVTVPVEKADIFNDKTNTIYENPDFNSVILEKDSQLQNRNFKLIEIGKMEKNNDTYNIWYKIKNSYTEGWVFGLLATF